MGMIDLRGGLFPLALVLVLALVLASALACSPLLSDPPQPSGGTGGGGGDDRGSGDVSGDSPPPEDQTLQLSCEGVTCGGHGRCVEHPGAADFDSLYSEGDTSATVSGSGRHQRENGIAVCACDRGFTASREDPLTCQPTSSLCKSGPIDLDWNEDGVVDTVFEPSESECFMFELINLTRATHDDQGRPECHAPLGYDLEWSARGRRHSLRMEQQGSLYHDDFSDGQNVAMADGSERQIDLYMNGEQEPHCLDLSHHCNIMFCDFVKVGIGNVPLEGESRFNTQNFLLHRD